MFQLFVVFLIVIVFVLFCFAIRRRHTRCALVTGVQTCALPISRLIALLLALLSLTLPARAADDISAVSRSVVRVVTVAMVDGEVVGFGHGSGIAVTPTRILTNAHVVESAAKYPRNVALGVVPSEGQKSYPGKLIAIDTARDLALIEMEEGRVPSAAVYTGPLESGADVVVLGYPGNEIGRAHG